MEQLAELGHLSDWEPQRTLPSVPSGILVKAKGKSTAFPVEHEVIKNTKRK